MSTTTQTLPACDCLIVCGGDPRLKNGEVAACEKLTQRREQDQQRALEFVRVNLIMQQYGVTTVYDLVEHLHTKVEQLPTNIDPRWADIDFDKVNAELRDLRAQVGRLQAHIDRTQPISTNSEGYVESTKTADAKTLLESAAALCDAEVDLRMKAAWQHADGSANRDRCYAAARAAGACADAIRAMKDAIRTMNGAFTTPREVTNG